MLKLSGFEQLILTNSIVEGEPKLINHRANSFQMLLHYQVK